MRKRAVVGSCFGGVAREMQQYTNWLQRYANPVRFGQGAVPPGPSWRPETVGGRAAKNEVAKDLKQYLEKSDGLFFVSDPSRESGAMVVRKGVVDETVELLFLRYYPDELLWAEHAPGMNKIVFKAKKAADYDRLLESIVSYFPDFQPEDTVDLADLRDKVEL